MAVDITCAHMEGQEYGPDVDGIAIGKFDRRGDVLAAATGAVLLPKLKHRFFRPSPPAARDVARRSIDRVRLDIGIASDHVLPCDRGKRRPPH